MQSYGVGELDGLVRVYIVPRPGYTIGSRNALSSVAVRDNDGAAPAGVTVEPQRLTREEGGPPGVYSVALSKEPLAEVSVAVSVQSPSVARVSSVAGSSGASAVLTFTPRNWDRPQSVVVLPQDDADSADGSTRILHAVQGTGEYARLAAPAVSVAVADDDVTDESTGFRLTVASDRVRENAGRMPLEFAVGLNGAPVDPAARPDGMPFAVYALDGASTAQAGSDYRPVPLTTIVIPGGARSATGEVELELFDNRVAEPARQLVFEASPLEAASELGLSRASLTIVDDDSGHPDEPTGLVAMPTEPRTLRLTWEPPGDEGASRVSGYMVEASDDGASWYVLRINTGSRSTEYTDPSVPEGVSRHYRVSAITLSGTGQPSVSATGTAAR